MQGWNIGLGVTYNMLNQFRERVSLSPNISCDAYHEITQCNKQYRKYVIGIQRILHSECRKKNIIAILETAPDQTRDKFVCYWKPILYAPAGLLMTT